MPTLSFAPPPGVPVAMAACVWLTTGLWLGLSLGMAGRRLQREELKCVLMESGVPSLISAGTALMLMWSAGSWGTMEIVSLYVA